MDEIGWHAVQEIFSRVADLPVEERRAAVQEICADDHAMFAEVMELLEEDDHRHPLLDSSLEETARSVLDFGQLPSLIQRQVGPYRLLDLLGEGGMGVVYLAERIDIGGRVAIKLLRDAWLSPMRRDRFRLEQLTLARLNHPSIARIYDSGTLEEGTPWFVMEYAEGLPLTEHWKRFGGSMRECLQLMRRVSESVQFAHSHAIIHRDLKPSNILVNKDREVKLLDFGIAKQLNEDSSVHPTTTGLRLMTLCYAAPEQLAGGLVGMYTDVYALGVLLYELSTGRLPNHVVTVAEAEDGTAAVGRETERPSTVIRRLRPELSRQLSKSEWSDLDSLTLKALEPKVDRRYGTVDALLRDLDALLDGRPLEARPADWRYTIDKFLRRNRRTLITVAATLSIVTGMILFYTVRLARARNAAVREADRTLRIQQFTENLFEGGDTSAGPANDLRVVELLDRGRHETEGLGNDPEMQADLRETLGGIYQKLGRLELAEPLLLSALDERKHVLGPNHQKVGESLVALGLLRKEQGRLEEAEQLLRDGLQILQRRTSNQDSATARAMVSLGSVLEVRGKYDEEKDILETALKLQPQNENATADTAQNLEELANVYFYKGRYESSEALNRQAFDIYRRLFGAKHPAVAEILNNLGAIETNRGNYGASEAYYRQALSITEAWYGADHPETAANLTALAQQLSYQKHDDEAQVLLERALAIQKHIGGGISSTVATTLNQLGMLAFNRNQFDAARSYFVQAMEIWRQSRGDEHEFVAISYSNLGSVCLGQKDNACAEKNYREAVRRFDAVSKDSLNAAIAHLKLGRALLREGQLSEAETESSHAYQYLVKHVPPTNGFLTASRKDLVAIYEGLRRDADAARYRSELSLASATK